MEEMMPYIVAAVVVLGVLITVWRGRDKDMKLDPEGARLWRKRGHWRRKDGGRSPGSIGFTIQLTQLSDERNRRLNELLADRDVTAAAALLEAAGFPEAEAIDRAERYTLREHPLAEIRGLPAQNGKRRPDADSFDPASDPMLSTAAERAAEEAAAPMAEEDAEAEIEALIRRGRKIEAIKLYRQHRGSDLRSAKAAVEALERELKARG